MDSPAFVWDPISDRLVAVYTAGGTKLLRQIIHGGSGYDDPIEVALPGGRLYLIFDEAGAGTLQVILNDAGEGVSRSVAEGAYGEDEFALAGAAVDRIAITAKKSSAGAIESVQVEIRATETLAPATVATGARLAVVDENGAVVRSAPATPTLIDNESATLRWTLTGAEWTALVAPSSGQPHSLSIAVTRTLRAAAWSADNGILPPTTPALHTSATLPVESREPLSALTTWLDQLAPSTQHTTVVFSAPRTFGPGGDVPHAAPPDSGVGIQALPFAEPVTGVVYARARWYDPATGSFLSPDPLGYNDSSNLFAFGAGDPVNNRDPLGEGIRGDLRFAAGQYYTDVVTRVAVTSKAIKGIGKSVVKTVGGTVAAVNLIHEASKVGNTQAQVQFVGAVVSTHDAVAKWGRSAGQAIGEPELIGQAVNELQSDELAEEILDATILMASFVAPLEGLGAKGKIAQTAVPARGLNLAEPKPIQARPANVRFGSPRGGGGNDLARAYASQVTNGAEKAIYVNGVEFEESSKACSLTRSAHLVRDLSTTSPPRINSQKL